MNENTCYFYYRDDNRKPLITIAYRRSLANNSVLFGAAFCSSRDQFTKSLGRDIATIRLDEKPVTIDIAGGPIPRFDVHDLILRHIETTYEYTPARFLAPTV